jgi:blue light- and temperature-responsive anti-repressor
MVDGGPTPRGCTVHTAASVDTPLAAASLPACSFAYQPIVDTESGTVFAHEALVRGPRGESAASVFQAVDPALLHQFDRQARIGAIALASELGLSNLLSLNFLPLGLELLPDAIESLLEAAAAAQRSPRDLILEVTEGELIHDTRRFASRLNEYRSHGLRMAIDDFGAGYSGLNLLCDFQPDVIKLDMYLVRDIDSSGPRQAIVRAVIQACDDLGVEVIAEGVESVAEYDWFRRIGVRLFQGYLFGKPGFRSLPPYAAAAGLRR